MVIMSALLLNSNQKRHTEKNCSRGHALSSSAGHGERAESLKIADIINVGSLLTFEIIAKKSFS